MNSIYAIVFKDTKQILTPDSFKEYWKNYGGNNLYGWRAPKKLYFTIGRAKSGFAHIPEALKLEVEIARFDFAETVEDGEKLQEKQQKVREKREDERQTRAAKYQLEYAGRNLKEAKEKLRKIKESKTILIK